MNNVESWYYLQQGVSVGPMSRPAMEAMIRAGTLPPDTLVWPGYGEWIAAGSSSLAPVYGGGMAPPPPSPMPVSLKKDFLPKDPRVRLVVMLIIIAVGLYAIYDGVKELGGGGGGSPASINFSGCQGVNYNSVQCGFQNTGSTKGRVCLDVVVLCADGRHVASTCSDRMKPGESTTKLVKNFKPGIEQTTVCSSINYENFRN